MPTWADWDAGAGVTAAINGGNVTAESIKIGANGVACLASSNLGNTSLLYALYPEFDTSTPTPAEVPAVTRTFSGGLSIGWTGTGTPAIVTNVNTASDQTYSSWDVANGWVDQVPPAVNDWFTANGNNYPRTIIDPFGNIHVASTPADQNDSNKYKLYYSNNGSAGTYLGVNQVNGVHVLGIAVDPNEVNNVGLLYYEDVGANVFIKFVKSTNGGTSFGSPVTITAYTNNTFATDIDHITGSLTWGNGVIVAVHHYFTGGSDDDDIEWTYSDDDGATWATIQQDLVATDPGDKIKTTVSPDGNTVLFYQSEPVSGVLYVMIKTWDNALDTWSTALAPFDILSDGTPPSPTGSIYLTGTVLNDGTARFALYESGGDKVWRRDYGAFTPDYFWTSRVECTETA